MANEKRLRTSTRKTGQARVRPRRAAYQRTRPERRPAEARREIPAEARVALLEQFGDPSVFRIATIAVPKIGPSDVLVRLEAAGVGVWDAKIRDGSWAEQELPFVLGTDGAGVVVAKGSRVRRLDVGDEVWLSAYQNEKGGTYAELIVCDASNAGPRPSSLDATQAAASCVTGLTALQGVDDHLRLRRGETVLVFGASGAVGSLAVPFAKRRGAHVIGTATGAAARKAVLSFGADDVLDARGADFAEKLRELAPGGLDAVLALAGGPSLEAAIDQLTKGGRVAYPNGVEPAPRRRRGVETLAYDGEQGSDELARLAKVVDEIHLRPAVAATYPIARVAKAHERLEKGGVVGRIVLTIP